MKSASVEKLSQQITEAYNEHKTNKAAEKLFQQFLALLNKGEIRSANKTNSEWHANYWVKQGILLGFRLGKLKAVSGSAPFSFFDKHTYPLKKFSIKDNVRIVPGGTSVRSGAYIAPTVIVMPPAYVNVGSYVGKGSLVDSNVLVGSCAQVGERVHLSAAVQLGGVLEPVGALPVIIEDDAMIGGSCGIFEGTIVQRRAVLGSGVILNASTPVYDCVNERIITKNQNGSLIIPENAVVIAGARHWDSAFARAHGLGIYTPMIIKYRDEKTDARTALEESLR